VPFRVLELLDNCFRAKVFTLTRKLLAGVIYLLILSGFGFYLEYHPLAFYNHQPPQYFLFKGADINYASLSILIPYVSPNPGVVKIKQPKTDPVFILLRAKTLASKSVVSNIPVFISHF